MNPTKMRADGATSLKLVGEQAAAAASRAMDLVYFGLPLRAVRVVLLLRGGHQAHLTTYGHKRHQAATSVASCIFGEGSSFFGFCGIAVEACVALGAVKLAQSSSI